MLGRSVGIPYLGAWLAGNGCMPVYNLIEGKLDQAAQLVERITSDDQCVEFLTLPAYELID